MNYQLWFYVVGIIFIISTISLIIMLDKVDSLEKSKDEQKNIHEGKVKELESENNKLNSKIKEYENRYKEIVPKSEYDYLNRQLKQEEERIEQLRWKRIEDFCEDNIKTQISNRLEIKCRHLIEHTKKEVEMIKLESIAYQDKITKLKDKINKLSNKEIQISLSGNPIDIMSIFEELK